MITIPSTTSFQLLPFTANTSSRVYHNPTFDLTGRQGTINRRIITTNPDLLSHQSSDKMGNNFRKTSATFTPPDSTSIANNVIVRCEKPFDKNYYININFEIPDKDHVNAFQISIADSEDLQISYATSSNNMQATTIRLSSDSNDIMQNIDVLTQQGIVADSGSSLEFINKLKDIGFEDKEANRGTFFILLDEKPIDESKNILRFSFDQLEYKLKFSLISVKENGYEIKCSYPEISPIQSSEASLVTSVEESQVLTSPQVTSAKQTSAQVTSAKQSSAKQTSAQVTSAKQSSVTDKIMSSATSSNALTSFAIYTSSNTAPSTPVDPQSTPRSTLVEEGDKEGFNQGWLGILAFPATIIGLLIARKFCLREVCGGQAGEIDQPKTAYVNNRGSSRAIDRNSIEMV